MAKDLISEVRALKKRVESTKVELVRAEERHKRAKESLAAIEKEVEAVGCDSDGLDAKIQELESELQKYAKKVKAALDKTKEVKGDDPADELDALADL